jgi:hypothetical protein
MTACAFCGKLEGHKSTCDRPLPYVETPQPLDFRKLPEMFVLPEVDDYTIAAMIVSEQHCTEDIAKLVYMAKWVARLRETYVNIGKQLD